jgi:Isochorismatase family
VDHAAVRRDPAAEPASRRRVRRPGGLDPLRGSGPAGRRLEGVLRKEYFEQYDFALQPADAHCYRLVEDPGAHPVIDEPTFGKWGPHLMEIVGQGPITVTGVATDCCVLSTVLPAADAGVGVQVVSDACAGSSDDDHDMALHVMNRYSPLVQVTTTDEVLDR